MRYHLENGLAGLAALLIVGTAMTSVVVVPSADSPRQVNDAALTVPVLA